MSSASQDHMNLRTHQSVPSLEHDAIEEAFASLRATLASYGVRCGDDDAAVALVAAITRYVVDSREGAIVEHTGGSAVPRGATRASANELFEGYDLYCKARYEMGEEPLSFEDYLWLEADA